jgi:hypothetical protein
MKQAIARPKMVVALHYGTVIYDNIGAADRLDFTVIGLSHAQSQNTQITIASIAPSSRAFATRICRRYRPLSNPNRPSVTAIGGDRCRAHNRRFRRMNVCAASINRSISRLAR